MFKYIKISNININGIANAENLGKDKYSGASGYILQKNTALSIYNIKINTNLRREKETILHIRTY